MIIKDNNIIWRYSCRHSMHISRSTFITIFLNFLFNFYLFTINTYISYYIINYPRLTILRDLYTAYFKNWLLKDACHELVPVLKNICHSRWNMIKLTVRYHEMNKYNSCIVIYQQQSRPLEMCTGNVIDNLLKSKIVHSIL